MSAKRKKRIFDIIQIGKKDDFVSRAFDFFIVFAIVINIAVLFMETFESMAEYSRILRSIEFITILIFLIEYVLRIWTSEYLYPDTSKGKAVLKLSVNSKSKVSSIREGSS